MLLREQLCHRPCGQGQLQSDPSLRSTPHDPPRNMVNSFVRHCPEAIGHPPPNLEGAASEGSFWTFSLVPERHGTSNLAPLRLQLRAIQSFSWSMEPTPPRQGNLPLVICPPWFGAVLQGLGMQEADIMLGSRLPFKVINSLHPPWALFPPHPNRWQSRKSHLASMAVVAI